ncbi:DUF2381 family protein [Myxococcus sp. K15C18031901]|uniref:DUF2381 family protein n=1 Tax=Myxococcus dinghuensis TaxID=2906761 RepID=UPI0020A7B986|nr:DUF2381 family protein [Myxococcus dinghuensis]MCP3103842.1 DUF2381 family protein [Myxococcus dinghuensis]
MNQPVRLALAFVLAWGAAGPAGAAQAERGKRERALSVAASPSEPLPVVRVAHDTPTLFLFPAPINRKTLTFDETRIRVLDAGERSIIVQPVADLPEGERYEVGVFFADGRAPARAAFVLVTDPAEVDIRIDVQRPEQGAACPTDVVREPKPEDFVLLGLVDQEGVTVTPIKGHEDPERGFSVSRASAYRGSGWVLVDVKFVNQSGGSPWTPRDAMLTGRAGLPVRARVVTVETGSFQPGSVGRVLVAADVEQLSANPVFTLEILGNGRTLVLPNVRLPKRGPGSSQ